VIGVEAAAKGEGEGTKIVHDTMKSRPNFEVAVSQDRLKVGGDIVSYEEGVT